MNALELKETLYALPFIVKDEPIHNRISIIFDNARMLFIHVNDDDESVLPSYIDGLLTASQREQLESALWHFRATPPFMRQIDEWRKRTAHEAYYNNQQLLKDEPLGALERHWILEEQDALKKLF